MRWNWCNASHFSWREKRRSNRREREGGEDRQRGEVRERRREDEEEEQKVQGGERGSNGRESPTSAVTTTRLAAAAADCDCCSNKAGSCHKHLLFNTTHMYSHLWTHTDAARVALCAFPLYGSLLSFFSFFCPCSLIRPAVIALCSV